MSDKNTSHTAQSVDDAGSRNRAHSNSSNDDNAQPLNGVGRTDRARSISPNNENAEPLNGADRIDPADQLNTRKTRTSEYKQRAYECTGNKRKKRAQMCELANKKKLKHTNEEAIQLIPPNDEAAAYGIETMVEHEINAQIDNNENPGTNVAVEQEVTENFPPVVISSVCVRCVWPSHIRLICKHTVCQRCERIEQWAANNQPCNKCGELDSLKQQIVKLEKQLNKPSQAVKKATQISGRAITKRWQKLHTFILQLSGGKKTDDADVQTANVVALLIAYLKAQPNIAEGLRQKKAPGLQGKLTVAEDLEIFADTHLTEYQRRLLAQALRKLGLNPFVSDGKFSEAKKKAQMETELLSSKIDISEGRNRPLVTVASVKDALTQKVRDMKMSGKLRQGPKFHGKILITIGGDKGGSTTKLVAAIANAKKPNSPDYQVILGTYKGTDNAENLRTAFTQIAADLAEISTIPVPVTKHPDSAMTEVPVKYILIGDTMFLSHSLGHMGPHAVYPCSVCTQTKDELKEAKNWDHTKTHPDRTLETYKEGVEIAQLSNAKGRDLSAQTKSVTQEPLFQIPIANVCPPQMHIMMGVGGDLYKSLEECCWKYDMQSAGLNALKSVKESITELDKNIKHHKQRVTALRINQDHIQKLHEGFIKAEKSPPKPAKPCNGIVCVKGAVKAIKKCPSDSISCFKCRRRFHLPCEGLATMAAMYVALDAPYKCQKCLNPKADIKILINITANSAKNNAKDLNRHTQMQSQYEQEREVIKNIVEKQSGPCVKRLAQALDYLKVDLQAYHTRSFVGNHMRNLLAGEGPAVLAAALGDNTADREKYEKLLTGLGRIQDYFEARLLEEEEIDDLERRCSQFAVDFKQLMPNESITPKMHFLVAHVPSFARRHGTIGLFSEQSLESLHATINGIDRQFAGIRDPERRMRVGVHAFHLVTSIRAKKSNGEMPIEQ